MSFSLVNIMVILTVYLTNIKNRVPGLSILHYTHTDVLGREAREMGLSQRPVVGKYLFIDDAFTLHHNLKISTAVCGHNESQAVSQQQHWRRSTLYPPLY